jgi:hypothetical protein
MAHLQIIQGGEAMGMGLADYIWVEGDGSLNFKKGSILIGKNNKGEPVPILPRWAFEHLKHTEGCDTTLHGWCCNCKSEATSRILVPGFFLPDPTRPQPNYIVICEVRDANDQCVEHNERAKLRQALEDRGKQVNLVWFGFEQNYSHEVMSDSGGRGFVAHHFEASRFSGAERHIGACFDAGILFHSAWNQSGKHLWDFKVGYRGFPQDLDPHPPNALIVADHLIIARYLMEKICASKGLQPLWEDLAAFVSTAALREVGGDSAEVAKNLSEACVEVGTTRCLPHPARPEYRCVEVSPGKPNDPYKLALDVLNAVWPTNLLITKE